MSVRRAVLWGKVAVLELAVWAALGSRRVMRARTIAMLRAPPLELATAAVARASPSLMAIATTVTLARAPGASIPKAHLTSVPERHSPRLGRTETMRSPTDRLSVRLTSARLAGPTLRTINTNVSRPPGCVRAWSAVCVIVSRAPLGAPDGAVVDRGVDGEVVVIPGAALAGGDPPARSDVW
jgi:hypothetical protein